MTQLGHILSTHEPPHQSGVTGGELDPYNALFVNMDNMWTERFGNYDCLVHKGIEARLKYLEVVRKRSQCLSAKV